MLGRLGLQLSRRLDIGHQRDVDAERLQRFQLVPQLPDRLHEGQRFDVTHRPADFTQDEIEAILFGQREFLDRVGDVRDHLHRCTQVIAAPFAGDDVAVNPARRDIVALPRGNAGKAFVMPQIEIGFGPVIGDIDLTVLIRAHRARIDVEIGIELADADFIAARLQQRREACRHQTFAKRGDHAAGDKNEPRHGSWALICERDSGQANCASKC